MDTIFDAFEYGMVGLGMLCGWFFGGFDGFYGALVAFTAMDYVTGLFAAAIRKELSSEVGFQGIARKVTIFILVGVANVLDTQLLGQGAALRLAVIFFYLANEGLSIMENAAEIGLPVPAKLKEMLTQIHRRSRDASAADPPAAKDALKETVRDSMDAARLRAYVGDVGAVALNATGGGVIPGAPDSPDIPAEPGAPDSSDVPVISGDEYGESGGSGGGCDAHAGASAGLFALALGAAALKQKRYARSR